MILCPVHDPPERFGIKYHTILALQEKKLYFGPSPKFGMLTEVISLIEDAFVLMVAYT